MSSSSDGQPVDLVHRVEAERERATRRDGDPPDRRSHQRTPAAFDARLAMRGQHITAATDVVDISESGVLLASVQPLGTRAEDRVCLTLVTPSGTSHRLGRVVRTTRGDDFRSYIAIEFIGTPGDELARALDDFRRFAAPTERVPATSA